MPFKEDKTAGIDKKHDERYMDDEKNREQPRRTRLREISEEDLFSSLTADLVASLGNCCRTFTVTSCAVV